MKQHATFLNSRRTRAKPSTPYAVSVAVSQRSTPSFGPPVSTIFPVVPPGGVTQGDPAIKSVVHLVYRNHATTLFCLASCTLSPKPQASSAPLTDDAAELSVWLARCVPPPIRPLVTLHLDNVTCVPGYFLAKLRIKIGPSDEHGSARGGLTRDETELAVCPAFDKPSSNVTLAAFHLKLVACDATE